MGRLLRTLIVEDSSDDALLLLDALRRQGFDPAHERVEDPTGMRAALQQREWDVVISDFNLPRFSAPAALYLMRQLGLDLPFIIVSGVIGEESAVSALKAGAHDFILKGSYSRLGTSIERELREAEIRREARRVKAMLQESEAHFRALAENSSDLITILNRDLTVRYQSPSVERMLGFRPEDLVGTHGLSRIHPDDIPRLEKVLSDALSGLQSGSAMYRVRRKDGSWRVHEAIGRNLLDNPAVRGIVVNSRDVTERVEAEDALKRSEARYRGIVETAAEGIAVTDADGRTAFVNEQLCRMLDRRAEELNWRPITELLDETNAAVVRRQDEVRRGGARSQYELQFRRPDGTLLWVLVNASPIMSDTGEYLGSLALMTDITERLEAEQALKRSEARYRRLIETAEEGIWMVDAAGATTFVNEKMARMLGYRPEEMLGRTAADFVAPEQQAVARGRMELNRVETLHYDAHFVRKDGSDLWVIISTTPIADETGANVGGLAMCTDVTDRKAAEERLRTSEVHYRSLIERMTDVVLILSPEGKLRYATPSVESMLGYTPAEVMGRDMFELMHPEDHARVHELFVQTVASAETRSAEYRFRHKNGSYRTLQSIATNLLDQPAVNGIVVNTRDVTDRRVLEAQLQTSQRLEAIGRLAGGMAHDFNNILTVIRTSAEFLLQGLPGAHELRADAEEIVKSSDRAAALTRQLLAFSKRQVLQPRVLDIDVLLQELQRMLRRLLLEDIELSLEAHGAELLVRADPGQVEQMIMNLVVNARDAMPEGGKLSIETRAVVLGEGDLVARPGCRPGAYLELLVRDTGCGMPPEVKERIFEPFFTTKDKGTGLGLPTVYGIVQQSGGFITVESEPWRGTTFAVYLPLVSGAATSGEASPPPLEAHGTEVVLLTEDDAAVRALARRSLERLGYHVLEADGAEAALEIARAHEGCIDLLLTDVVMPGQSGRDLAIAFAAIRPNAKVVYMSGYADRAVEGGLPPEAVLVEKPFSADSLGRKLRQALGAPARV